MTDRKIHAEHRTGWAFIVRYDRAGKWYFETDIGTRHHITVAEAVKLAKWYGFEHKIGVPGGSRFDKLMTADTP